MKIQSITSTSSIVMRLALATIGGAQRVLGHGQAVPVRRLGDSGKEGLCPVALVGGQVEMIDSDTVACHGGQVITLSELSDIVLMPTDLAEKALAGRVPSADALLRKVAYEPGQTGPFCGFVGSRDWKSLTWAAVSDFLPSVDVLDALRAGTAGPQLGDEQGWFLRRANAQPRQDGRKSFDPSTGQVIEGLIDLPIPTAIHAYFLGNMRKAQRRGEPVFGWLGADDQASKAAIAKAIDKVLANVGAKEGDTLYFGHISRDPIMQLLEGKPAHELYRSYYFSANIRNAQAMQGWDGASAAHLRNLGLGVGAAPSKFLHGRVVTNGLVTLDEADLRAVSEKLRRKPKVEVAPAAPKPEKTYVAHFDNGTERTLNAAGVREAVASSDDKLALTHVDGYPLIHCMVMSGLIPLPAKMHVQDKDGAVVRVFPRDSASAEQWATILAQALTQDDVCAAEGTKFVMQDLTGNPVWGTTLRPVALALEGLEADEAPAAAPAMSELVPAVEPASV